jgi:hypothetical protein
MSLGMIDSALADPAFDAADPAEVPPRVKVFCFFSSEKKNLSCFLHVWPRVCADLCGLGDLRRAEEIAVDAAGVEGEVEGFADS